MKILLIYPYCLENRLNAEDAGVVPIGVYYVGAVLKRHSHDVEILNWHDMRDTPDRMEEILARKRPDVIGFSILHANRWGGIEIARIAKRIDPLVSVVFGGIGATNLWRHFLTHFPEIDAVVLGEGEVTFLELIRHLEGNGSDAMEEIDGLAFRSNGNPIRTGNRPFTADIDQLPNPADFFTYQHIALTRGCPGRCNFCGSPRFWGPKVRFHSPAYFVDQMERLYNRGVTFFFVSDDTFTLKKGRVIEICRQIIRRRMPITWAAISRVDTVDGEVLYWMRKAGCVQISYGVESGSEKHRKFLNKPIDEKRIRKAFSLTVNRGILARAYFIYGCPGENRDTIRETLDLMDTIRPLSAIFYILDIFPGTALYEDYKLRTGATDDIWLNRIEDIMYFEVDPRLSQEEILAFGKTLRTHFHTHLPSYAEAIALIDRKEMAPLHADFFSRLAMTFDQGDYAHIETIPDKECIAETLYRKALTWHPDARAYLGLGIMAQKAMDYDESVRILSEGVSHFPDDLQLNICLAVTHMNMGRFDTALARLLPFQQSADARRFIAGCYEAMGQPEKAAEFAS